MKKNKVKLALDLETTGFDATNDNIIEVGMVKFDENGEIERWSSLVRHKGKLPEVVANLTGIKEAELEEAPTWEQVKLVVAQWLREADCVVGHNIAFDIDFLSNNGISTDGIKLIDTWYLANMLVTDIHSYSLESLSRYIKWEYDAHRALEDTLAVVGLYQYLEGMVRSISDEILHKVVAILQKGDWNYAYLFQEELNKRQGNYCVSRPKIWRKVKIDYRPQKFSSQYVIAELSRRELIQSIGDQDWLVISRDEFNFWENFDLSGFVLIDEQRRYLCRQKLRKLLHKIKLRQDEVAVLVKIVMQIERQWDGHLSRLNIFDEEREVVDELRCGAGGLDHAECFYENKFRVSGKKVMTWPILRQLSRRELKSDNLWYWVNDNTLEDGMTQLTNLWVDRRLWENLYKDLEDNQVFDGVQLENLYKQIEMLWGMAGLLIKSQGVNNGVAQVLDFTPTLYKDLSVVPVRKVVKDILSYFNQIDSRQWNQNMQIAYFSWKTFLENWLNQDGWMMTGKLVNGEMSFALNKIDFRDVVQDIPANRLILAAPVVFFAGKLYSYRLFFDQEKVEKLVKRWDVRLDVDYQQSDQIIDSSWWEKYASSLLVFSSRDKGENWLDKIKDKPYHEQVNNLLVGRKNLMSELTGLSVINFHNIRHLRKTVNQFDCIYLDSLPFDVPDSLSIGYRSTFYGEASFQDYYLSRMYSRLFSLVHFIKPGGQLIIGDSRLWEKSYGEKIIEVFHE